MKYIIFLLLFALPVVLIGQQSGETSDFDYYMEEGKRYFDLKQFDSAKGSFRIAKDRVSRNSPLYLVADEWYVKSVDADVAQLKAVLAENIRLRKLAEVRAKIAASSLKALQAENEIKAGDYNLAFQHALEAKVTYDSLGRDSVPVNIEKAFGQAVQHHLTDALFEPTGGVITDFDLVPDSDLLLVTLGDSALIKVNTVTKEFNLLIQKPSIISTIALSPTGTHLFAAYSNNEAFLVDIENAQYSFLEDREEPIVFSKFSPDGQYVLSCARDNQAILWNLKAELVSKLVGHTQNIYQADFSPTEEKILTRSFDGTVRLWDYQGNSAGKKMKHRSYIYSAFFSKDGKEVITAAGDGKVRAWDSEGKFLKEIVSHEDVIRRTDILPDGNHVLSYSIDHQLKVYDKAKDKAHSFPYPEQLSAYDFPDQKVGLITGRRNGYLTEYQIEDDVAEKRNFQAHNNSIVAIDHFGEKDYLLSTAMDGNGQSRLWTNDQDRYSWFTVDLKQPKSRIIPTKFSRDGKYLFAIINNELRICPLPDVVYGEEKVKGE